MLWNRFVQHVFLSLILPQVTLRRALSLAIFGSIVSIVWVLWTVDQATPNAHVTDEAPAPADLRSLSLLVQEYLEAGDGAKAADALKQILRHPGADLSTVEPLVRSGQPYSPQPVGLQPGRPVLVRGRTYRYGLSVPSSYRPTKAYPLVVCLHGAGFTGDSYLARWESRLGNEYILACPTLLNGNWWSRKAEDLVLATIRTVRARYRIDADRILLTGMSNGGIGAYLIGMHQAPLFAGVAPMASGLDDVLFPFLQNLLHTPVYIIHGKYDQVMPVELSRSIVDELTRLGYTFVYREHHSRHPMAGGHFFPREELGDLVAWFSAQRRDPLPKRVTVIRDASHLTAFSWVRIDATDRIASFSDQLINSRDEAIVNRIYATLEASIVAPNRIEVHTQHVRRYSLFLNEELINLRRPVTIVTNGRVSYEGTVPLSLETLLRQARLRQERQVLFPAIVRIAVDSGP